MVQSYRYTFSAQVCAVVSQPGKPRGRGNKSTPLPTPVEQAAREVIGLSEEAVLCPRSAREVIYGLVSSHIVSLNGKQLSISQLARGLTVNLNGAASPHVTYHTQEYVMFIFIIQAPFLSALIDLKPDLCITAAYGNMLPQVCRYAVSEWDRRDFKLAFPLLCMVTGIVFLMTVV